MARVNDLTNQRFGQLLVLKRAGSNKRGRATWLCLCSCGKKIVVTGSDLLHKQKSCGCTRNKSLSDFNKKTKTTHGMRYTRLYSEWRAMLNRCSCSSWRDFNNYGGRGITVCEEWRQNFDAFRDWALTNGYDDTLTLDRIDVNGNYEPSNCRWATLKEQANNTRKNHYVEFNGEKKTIKQWAEDIGINYSTLCSRLKKWDIEKALTTPVDSKV